jgi:formylglycine-generating enzyme required for sulfatase activity
MNLREALSLSILFIAIGIPVRAEAPKTQKIPIPKSVVEFEMVRIPGGQLEMTVNGEKKVIEVKPFWIGKYEVTWDEFDIFYLMKDLTQAEEVAENNRDKLDPKRTRPTKPQGDPAHSLGHGKNPAGSLSFKSAGFYCQWLSAKTGRKFRIPTEAEWEYAARAGGSADPIKEKDQLDKVAWFKDNSGEEFHPVGQKQPNAWGLHDTLGNVMEWVVGHDGKPVACGGSFMDRAPKISVGSRQMNLARWQMDPQFPQSTWWFTDGHMVGLRVAMDE